LPSRAAVIGQQRFVFVDVFREAIGEILDEIEQRTLAVFIQGADRLVVAHDRGLVLRHRFGQIAIHAARTVIGGVHARAGYRLVTIHQIFALAERIQQNAHCADVESMRTDPHQVVQQARDFVEHDADVLGAQRHLDAEQLFDRHHIRMLVAHHGDVIEPVHVGNRLQVSFLLRQLFRRAMQQPDMRIGALDHLAVELQHQTQNTVRGRMLRAEVESVILDFCHYLIP
jgi:hypothetical protein